MGLGSDITVCSGKNNSDDGEIKILTGLDDVSKLGTIVTYDQKTEQDYWTSSEDIDAQECNSIRGSDGSLFPPFISKNQTLYIYNKAMCRSLALEFSVSMEGRAGSYTDLSGVRRLSPTKDWRPTGSSPARDPSPRLTMPATVRALTAPPRGCSM